MECFLRDVFEGKGEDAHEHFVRFGKGDYRRRFLLNFAKGKKIKLRGSFEWANDFVKFVRENKDVKFSGTVLSKKEIDGQKGKKKAGSFVYEVSESSLEEFEEAYFNLVNVNDDEIVLKIKKKLPKPGKNEDKIDDKFCALDLDLKFLDKVKETFLWDVGDCKKAKIEHDLHITDIEVPKGIEDPVEMRAKALRIGNIVRRIDCDGKVKEEEFELRV